MTNYYQSSWFNIETQKTETSQVEESLLRASKQGMDAVRENLATSFSVDVKVACWQVHTNLEQIGRPLYFHDDVEYQAWLTNHATEYPYFIAEKAYRSKL